MNKHRKTSNAKLDRYEIHFNKFNEESKLKAKYRRALFNAHVEAGFTESQALAFCKLDGLT